MQAKSVSPKREGPKDRKSDSQIETGVLEDGRNEGPKVGKSGRWIDRTPLCNYLFKFRTLLTFRLLVFNGFADTKKLLFFLYIEINMVVIGCTGIHAGAAIVIGSPGIQVIPVLF